MKRAMVQRYRREGVVRYVITTDLLADCYYLTVLVKPDEPFEMFGRANPEPVDQEFLVQYKNLVSNGWMRDGDPLVRHFQSPTVQMLPDGWIQDVLIPSLVGLR